MLIQDSHSKSLSNPHVQNISLIIIPLVREIRDIGVVRNLSQSTVSSVPLRRTTGERNDDVPKHPELPCTAKRRSASRPAAHRVSTALMMQRRDLQRMGERGAKTNLSNFSSWMPKSLQDVREDDTRSQRDPHGFNRIQYSSDDVRTRCNN